MNPIPDPATRSLTVPETSTSPAEASAATRAAMWTATPPTSVSIRWISPEWTPIRTSSAIAPAASPMARPSPLRSGCPAALHSRLAVGAWREEADFRSLALERYGRSLLEVVAGRAQGAQRGLGDQDVVAGQSRGGLHAGCRVHWLSDDGEVAPPASTHCADHNQARVHAEPDSQRAAYASPHELGDLAGGRDRAVCMIDVALRRAEDGQESVSDELVRMPAVVQDDWDYRLVEIVQTCDDLVWGRTLGEPAEPAYVEKEE